MYRLVKNEATVLVKWRRILKLIHLTGTAWFVLSAGYVLVLTLLMAGKSWWFIVSLSGYSALTLFLLISLYLFAVFRGVSRNQKIVIEHPLTTSPYYYLFYSVSPFLGGLAGSFAAIGIGSAGRYLLVVATGSLWVTFVVWIIIDPMVGFAEMLLPSSRGHRRNRLAQAQALRLKQRLDNERLLAEVQVREETCYRTRNDFLLPYAVELAGLIYGGEKTWTQKQIEAVDIGMTAWQMDGLDCMRQLHSMALELCGQKCENSTFIDYISVWWDGVGSWRSCQLDGDYKMA